jgi:hypothetical protein
MKEILLFIACDKYFGLELPLIRSIHRVIPALIKQEDDGIKYMIKGGDIPLCDFSAVLGERVRNTHGKKIMIISVRNQAMSLMVDRVERVVSAQIGQIESLPSIFKGKAAEWFPKVLWYEEHPILLLNPDGMGYIRQPELPVGLEQMVSHIFRENAVADIMVKGLSQALKDSASHGAERIRDILERHDKV